ncbi:MAG: hypothetical protein A2792_00165 [Sphingomonadales bacterium RIFCSPHIGHO2_01_FULL_65_20]|nr:MAG: hypothetical protein A2792_00165 [Sphingomonadales bacterium RIFCSPHIGHO2_01_FULL_65_20]
MVRGETQITRLTLRKPGAGELRGLSLKDVLMSDIATIIEIVPRISDPILTDHEANTLEPGNLAVIGGVLRGFFLTKAEQAAIKKMMEG